MAENQTNHSDLITSFTEITSSSIEEATFFLESHNFDLDSAVSTFFETTTVPTTVPPPNPNSAQNIANAIDDVNSPPSSSPSRSRSVSPPPSFEAAGGGGRGGAYNLRSRNATGKKEAASGSGRSGRIRTFADLNSDKHCDDCDSGSDEDEPQEYYTGGHKR